MARWSVWTWVGVVGYWGLGGGAAGARRVQVRAYRPEEVRVVDGDTVVAGGVRYRMLAVDTPEAAAPWFEGSQEPWAGLAKGLVARAVQGSEGVTVHTWGDEDHHGRVLGHVFCDGAPVAEALVRAGLAVPTVGVYGDGGFPVLAERVVRASWEQGVPFEEPWRWRRAHRRR